MRVSGAIARLRLIVQLKFCRSAARPVDVGGGQYQIDVHGVTARGPFALTLAATSTSLLLQAMSTP